MPILVQHAKEYFQLILKKKVRFIIFIFTTMVLFTLSSNYLYQGFNKKFLIYTLLCLFTGFLLVCPKPNSPWPTICLTLLYFIWVPHKMFQRMELPLHDMHRIMDGAELANFFIIFLVYALLLLILQHINLALGVGNIILFIFFLVNYYVNQFQGGTLTFSNLLAAKTAFTVLDNYHLTMSGELWYSILYFCFFIVLGFRCSIPLKKILKHHGVRYYNIIYHSTVTAVALIYCLFFSFFWKSDYLDSHQLEGTYWSVRENEELNGFLLGFGFSIRDMAITKPAGYSSSAIEEIIRQTEENYIYPQTIDKKKPDIILIMNESWSDLRVLGNLELSEDFMPYTDSLTDNTVRGNLFVEILGGITANSEFEVLTGDTLAFLPTSSIPYQLEINHDMYSIARVLKEQGYQTMAVHPNAPMAWYRDNVYNYFGFDSFIDLNIFETPHSYIRNFISDECNFNELIWQYEHRDKDKPFFLFNVTIQNHGGYYGEIDLFLALQKVGNTSAEGSMDFYDAETYLNLMKISDDAFKGLLDYFSKVEDPVIICMFGDHQPLLGDLFYEAIFEGRGLSEEEQIALQYITPYVIWANYDIEYPEYGDMSSNYLGAAILECAGAELPAYYKYLLLLHQQYPEISRRTIRSFEEEKPITQYRILQYNQLIEKDIPNPLFSLFP